MAKPYVFRRPFEPRVFGRKKRGYKPVYTFTASATLGFVAGVSGSTVATQRPAGSFSLTVGFSGLANVTATPTASLGAILGMSGVGNLQYSGSATFGLTLGKSIAAQVTARPSVALSIQTNASGSLHATMRPSSTFAKTLGKTNSARSSRKASANLSTTHAVSPNALTAIYGAAALGMRMTIAGVGAIFIPIITNVFVNENKTNLSMVIRQPGGGSKAKPQSEGRPKRKPIALIQREIEIVGKDGLPKKVPLLERFAPPPPPPPLEIIPWVGKPPRQDLSRPLQMQLPLPDLPTIETQVRAALDARDMQDAMAALKMISDPVEAEVLELIQDLLDA